MSAKLELATVATAAKQIGFDPEKIQALIERLSDMTAPENDGEEKPPAVKKQWVILISDPKGILPRDELVGWVLQIPEAESVVTTEERIRRAAYDFNATKKGRLLPVQTVGETLEHVPAKHFKEAGAWVRTKTPVFMLRTENEIPKTDGLLADGNRGNFKKEAA